MIHTFTNNHSITVIKTLFADRLHGSPKNQRIPSPTTSMGKQGQLKAETTAGAIGPNKKKRILVIREEESKKTSRTS